MVQMRETAVRSRFGHKETRGRLSHGSPRVTEAAPDAGESHRRDGRQVNANLNQGRLVVNLSWHSALALGLARFGLFGRCPSRWRAALRIWNRIAQGIGRSRGVECLP
jgi:hypothetical protein